MESIVQPILSPNAEAMTRQLQHLFGGDLDGLHDGLIELAWQDARDGALRHAELFATDQIDELVARACRINAVPGQSCFIGAALRKPGTFPGGRCEDTDFYALPAYYVDLDDEGVAEQAKGLYRGCKPTLVVITGRRPHLRAQLWWRHETPERDPAVTRAQLVQLAVAMKGDMTVVNPSRVMRLAGSIAWPTKPGRVLEATELQTFDDRLQQYTNGELKRAFPVEAGGLNFQPAGPNSEAGTPTTEQHQQVTAPFPGGPSAAPKGVRRLHTLALSPFTGTSPDELIAKIRALKAGDKGWRGLVLPLIGHWINRNWTDAEILGFSPYLTMGGYAEADTVRDFWKIIRDTRKSWHIENPNIKLGDSPAPSEDADEGPFPATDLVGDPPARQWIIPDWLPAGEATGLYGDGGVGKTLFAQQAATTVATGSDFMGMKVAAMPVLAVLCEDDRNELHRRQHAINNWLGCAMHPQLGRLQLWPRVGRDNFLAVYDRDGRHQLTPFYQRLFGLVTAIEGPKLVILDTLADLFGGNEIIRIQANHFVKAIVGRLVREAGATVLVLAHPSQAGMQTDGGSSGSTGWNNAFRQRLYLKKTEEEGANYDRELIRKKANYASTDPADCLKMVWEAGVLTNMGQGPKVVSPDLATAILKDIQIRWMDGNPFSPYARSGPFFLVPWMVRTHGFSRGEATVLMNAWISNGMMAVEMVSAKTKRQGLKVIKWPG